MKSMPVGVAREYRDLLRHGGDCRGVERPEDSFVLGQGLLRFPKKALGELASRLESKSLVPQGVYGEPI